MLYVYLHILGKPKVGEVTLWCHQTWLAGKSPMNDGFMRKITDKWSIFQHAMFDYRRASHVCKFTYCLFSITLG